MTTTLYGQTKAPITTIQALAGGAVRLVQGARPDLITLVIVLDADTPPELATNAPHLDAVATILESVAQDIRATLRESSS